MKTQRIGTRTDTRSDTASGYSPRRPRVLRRSVVVAGPTNHRPFSTREGRRSNDDTVTFHYASMQCADCLSRFFFGHHSNEGVSEPACRCAVIRDVAVAGDVHVNWSETVTREDRSNARFSDGMDSMCLVEVVWRSAVSELPFHLQARAQVVITHSLGCRA